MKHPSCFASFAALCLAGTSSSASADVSARYEMPQEFAPVRFVMTVEIDDKGDVRGQVEGQPSYFLVLNGVTYVVTKGPTGPFVAKMDDMAVVIGEMTSRMGLDKVMPSVPGGAVQAPSLVTLGPRLVNGRAGTAYGEPIRKGEKPFDVLVISADPKLAPLGTVFANSLQQSGSSFGKMIPGFASVAAALSPEVSLLQKGAPLQFMAFRLTDVSYDQIPSDRFAMPAAPLSREQLREQYSSFPAPPTLPKTK